MQIKYFFFWDKITFKQIVNKKVHFIFKIIKCILVYRKTIRLKSKKCTFQNEYLPTQ